MKAYTFKGSNSVIYTLSPKLLYLPRKQIECNKSCFPFKQSEHGVIAIYLLTFNHNLPAIACLRSVNIQFVLISKANSCTRLWLSPGRSRVHRELAQDLKNDANSKHPYQSAHLGPVVQSIISLTSSLRGQLIKCFTTI